MFAFLVEVWNNIDLNGLLNHFLAQFVDYLPRIGAAVGVLAAFAVGLFFTHRLLKHHMVGLGMPPSTIALFLKLFRYGIILLAVLTSVQQLGINVTSIIAGLGVAGLAVSLAAQDTIANVIAGISLVIDKPFLVGDWVEIAGVHALVKDIQMRTTTLVTFDNQVLVIPNRSITQERIINYTITPRIRVRVAVGIAYKEDIRQARQVMLGTLAGDREVLSAPAPDVVVVGLGASSIDMEMRFWIEEAVRQLPKRWEYIEKCKIALDEAGIEIPFPHAQVFLEDSAGLERLAESISRRAS